MKKLSVLLALAVFLSGCGENSLQRAMDLRTRLHSAGCCFTAEITGDYGDALHTFTLDCRGDPEGNMSFRVVEPESISGITGRISGKEGKLDFGEGKSLVFDLLTDEQLSPVSAPWLLLRTLRSGYLTAAGEEGTLCHVLARDSYEENALGADIWLDPQDAPVRAEFLYRSRRILTLEIRDFRLEDGAA